MLPNMVKITPVIPKPFNLEKFRLDLIEGMRDTGLEIREQFEDTVKTWRTKPRFEPDVLVPKVGVDSIEVETTTTDKKFLWIDEGTKRHPITAVNAKTLAFPGQFIPKTMPGIIGSGVGFSGPIDRFPVTVVHPGVEARNFSKIIADQEAKNFKINMERALSLARRSSGHAYP